MGECKEPLYPKDGESIAFWYNNIGYEVSVGLCDRCGHLIHKTDSMRRWVHSQTDEHESDKRPEPDPIENYLKTLHERTTVTSSCEFVALSKSIDWLYGEVKKLKLQH